MERPVIPAALLILLSLLAGAEARDADAPGPRFQPSGFGLLRTVVPGGDPAGLAFSPDGRRLAVGVANAVILFDTETWRELRRLEGPPEVLLSLAWSPDGGTIAAGGMDGGLALWDAKAGVLRATLQAHGTHIGALAFSPDGLNLVSAAHDGSARLWDPATAQERRGLLAAGPAGALSAAFSRDGRRLALGMGDGEARVWRTGTWEEEKAQGTRGTGNVLVVAFTRDGSRLAVATETVLSLGRISGGTASRFEIQTSGLAGLALSPDDRYAVAAGNDLSIRIHDLSRGGQEVAKFQHHTAAISGLAVRPDGRLIVTIGRDRHLKVWGRVPAGIARVRPKGFCGIRVQADATGRIVITDVIAGTAAQAAGMRAGDGLKSVGGFEIRSTADSVDRIGSYLVGDEVEFVVERNGETTAIKIRLGKRPEDVDN